MRFGIFKKFDWLLFSSVIILALTGILFIYSSQLRTGNAALLVVKQSTAFAIGFACMLLVINIRYEVYAGYTKFFYFFSLFLLVIVLIFGTTIRGSRSWFDFGKFSIQPSEIAKISIILYLAGFIQKNFYFMKNVFKLSIPLFATSAMVGLILLEPDFSSAAVFIPILFGMLFVGGVPGRLVVYCLIFFSVIAGLPVIKAYFTINHPGSIMSKDSGMIYSFLIFALIAISVYFLKSLRFQILSKDYKTGIFIALLGLVFALVISSSMRAYQMKRILVVFSPSMDPLGSGYNVLQSKIAIGSGKFSGKGIFSGTQTQLGFIPDRHTDFIFAVIAEEGGFIVSTVILLLYLVVILRGISIARNAADRFGSMIAAGIVIMFSFYIILNLGMLTGIMPVAGVPLPFISYGGSSLVVNMIAVGILMNIHIRRHAYGK